MTTKDRFGFMMAAPDRYALLKEHARENRKNMTLSESILWDYLRQLPSTFHFRRQHIIGDYIVDFVCLERSLVIEVDGGYHSEPRQIENDLFRTERLESYGFKVIRFENEQINYHIEEVMRIIKEILYNE
ncbi:MAG: endonuclease domain-containing protein [Prevotella sp.]